MQLVTIAAAAWLVAHLLKFSISAFHGNPDLRLFYRSGGMPSGHATTVTAAAVGALALEGLSSPVFGLAVVLAYIVVYDTLGMRRAVGEQAVALNAVSESSNHVARVREVHGHTVGEVMAGAGLGGAVGLLLTYQLWAPHATWLVATPGAKEQVVYAIVFAAVLLAGMLLRVLLARRYKVAVVKRLTSQVWWAFVLPAAIGLFFSLLQYQDIGTASGRLWTMLVVLAAAGVQVWLYLTLYRGVRHTYRRQVDERRQHRRRVRKSRESRASRKQK